MSLTSLIKTNKEIKAFLLRTMPRRDEFESSSAMPAFSKENPVVVPAAKVSYSAQIGMLTDFLFRYVTAKTVGIPMNYRVAQAGIALMQQAARNAEAKGANDQYVYYRSMALAAQESLDEFKTVLDGGDSVMNTVCYGVTPLNKCEKGVIKGLSYFCPILQPLCPKTVGAGRRRITETLFTLYFDCGIM